MRCVERRMSGWGRHPEIVARVYRPESVNDVREILLKEDKLIARGLGRSYGDSALPAVGGAVIDCTRLNRMLVFDENSGLLRAEAGVTIADVEAVFAPRGWFPPVVPGTRFITLGGAVAADVHGKNHHVDGSFGDHVNALTIMLGDGMTVECDRTRDPELFDCTIGGMGLTGIILEVEFQLMRIPSVWIRMDTLRTMSLAETLAAFGRGDDARYSVAWLDVLARRSRLGRGVIMTGEHAADSDLKPALRRRSFTFTRKRGVKVPFAVPGVVFRPWAMRLFNAAYFATHPTRKGAIVGIDSFFHPLDSLLRWNRVYGRHGFLQWQYVIPEARAEFTLTLLLRSVQEGPAVSFLAVLKRLGRGKPERPLSFPRAGWVLSLDIPRDANGRSDSLARHLSQIASDAGGRFYLAKDAIEDGERFLDAYGSSVQQLMSLRRGRPRGECFVSSQSVRLSGGLGLSS